MLTARVSRPQSDGEEEVKHWGDGCNTLWMHSCQQRATHRTHTHTHLFPLLSSKWPWRADNVVDQYHKLKLDELQLCIFSWSEMNCREIYWWSRFEINTFLLRFTASIHSTNLSTQLRHSFYKHTESAYLLWSVWLQHRHIFKFIKRYQTLMSKPLNKP